MNREDLDLRIIRMGLRVAISQLESSLVGQELEEELKKINAIMEEEEKKINAIMEEEDE